MPLLTNIEDARTNGALLTITRDNATGNISQVADAFGRSIYYQSALYSNQNVPSGYNQSQRELTGSLINPITGCGSREVARGCVRSA